MPTVAEFAKAIKTKYPEYANVDDLTLAKKVVEKHPEYADRVDFGAQATPQQATPPEAPATGLKGLGQSALRGLAYVGEKVDRVTGAPLRAALGTIQQTQMQAASPEVRQKLQNDRLASLDMMIPNLASKAGWQGLERGIEAGAHQFGRPAAEAPTGADLARNAGVSNTALSDLLPGLYSATGKGLPLKKGGLFDPTAAGVVGFGLDVAADPTNLVGLGEAKQVLNAAGKGGKMAAMGMMEAGKAGAKAAATTANALTGTQIGSKALQATDKGLKTLGKGYDALAETLRARYGTAVADDFAKSVEVAKRNGIDPNLLPEAVVFGPNKAVTRIARAKAEGPLGQPLLEKFQQASSQVQDAIRGDISRIGGITAPSSANEAGRYLVAAFDDGVERKLKDASTTYRSALSDLGMDTKVPLTPNAKLNLQEKLDRVKAYAQDLAENSFDDVSEAQGKQLLKAVDRMEKVQNYEDLITGLQGIGRTAFKTKNSFAAIPPDVAKFRELYGALKDAALETVEKRAGLQVADRLRETNQTLSQLFKDKELLSAIGDAKASPDKLFRSLVLQGDAARIGALKRNLSAEDLQALKGAFLKELVRETESPQGAFTVRMLANKLRQKDDAIQALFKPGELDNMRDLLDLWDKFGSPVLSTSGTGASISFKGLVDKPLQWAEKATEAGLSAKAEKAKKRALGFQLPEPPVPRQAARTDAPPTIMGLSQFGSNSGVRRRDLIPARNPRSSLARLLSIQAQNQENP